MHVITLQMTQNRMPRWLSEGISVWEEKRGPALLGASSGFRPDSGSSGAEAFAGGRIERWLFGARNNADLSFAYFQSYLVVDYIAQTYGFEKLVELIYQYGEIKEDADRFRSVFGLISMILTRVSEAGLISGWKR